MTTSAETKMGRLQFKRKLRMEMIDENEREIERRKSYNRTLKSQVKELSREIAAEYAKSNRGGIVSPAIPKPALPSMAEREREARLAMAVGRM